MRINHENNKIEIFDTNGHVLTVEGGAYQNDDVLLLGRKRVRVSLQDFDIINRLAETKDFRKLLVYMSEYPGCIDKLFILLDIFDGEIQAERIARSLALEDKTNSRINSSCTFGTYNYI